jgi:hypothetical protein
MLVKGKLEVYMGLQFIGRKENLNEFNNLLKKKTASLAVVNGRRRIGKSRLIEEFAKSVKKAVFYKFIVKTINKDKKITTKEWPIEKNKPIAIGFLSGATNFLVTLSIAVM